MESKKHSDNSFLTGLALGGIVGVGLAFFFGSDDKDKTRRLVVKKGKAILKSLSDVLEENTLIDLRKHWGSDEGEKTQKKEKKQIESPRVNKEKSVLDDKELASKSKSGSFRGTMKRFFHRNGRCLS